MQLEIGGMPTVIVFSMNKCLQLLHTRSTGFESFLVSYSGLPSQNPGCVYVSVKPDHFHPFKCYEFFDNNLLLFASVTLIWILWKVFACILCILSAFWCLLLTCCEIMYILLQLHLFVISDNRIQPCQPALGYRMYGTI